MADHSHEAYEVSAAEDVHRHYATEIDGAVRQGDFDVLVAKVATMAADIEALQRKLAAEHAVIEEVRAGALTIPRLAQALRECGDKLLAEASDEGLQHWESTPAAILAGELRILATEIEGEA